MVVLAISLHSFIHIKDNSVTTHICVALIFKTVDIYMHSSLTLIKPFFYNRFKLYSHFSKAKRLSFHSYLNLK